jgi:hypothetical protein
MECTTHPGRNSVGYCKKCGSFGCDECIVKVLVKGEVGKKSRPEEVLVCRDCLSKIRPDLMHLQSNKPRASKKTPTPRKRKAGKRTGKIMAVAVVVVVVAIAAWAAATVLPRINFSRQFKSAEEVAAEALAALSAGKTKDFFSCVDVRAFMCRMDSTGLTKRDYQQADGKRWAELEASHCELLTKDFFTSSNLRKKFTVTGKDIKKDSASVDVKPWIQLGNKLYKRVLLEKNMGQWKISGLASPDY